MTLAVFSLIAGLVLVVWSADRFVEGAAQTARYFKMPPLLIGMVIVGFGTSVPEMLVSAIASLQGSSGIALGNAYGSNIANIGLILGLTAIINPIMVHSAVLRRELPILTIVTLISILLITDFNLSTFDAILLLTLFCGLMAWSILQSMKQNDDSFAQTIKEEAVSRTMPVRIAGFWLVAGLIVLIASSRLFVFGAVELARIFGISEMIIGLTIVAIGTSLPELASSIIAARKGEHDIALGNVLGSNLFNTLAVVGIAGMIRPVPVPGETLIRDMPFMAGLTLSLFIIGYGFRKKQGRINRFEGILLLSVYGGYSAYLISVVW
ncbi:MAG: calcium/sodium antiporter [Chitinispirillaceae bacterium]|nr:calcium/sodium antiporter [Chitinispirillaceae bacterium]